jgi:hypothetical protein
LAQWTTIHRPIEGNETVQSGNTMVNYGALTARIDDYALDASLVIVSISVLPLKQPYAEG